MPRQLKIPWHEALLKCAIPHTEAPDRFMLWSAFSVLGSVLKNRCFINDGLYVLYPNQYIILVSPPGIGKGTAINFAWKVVRESGPNFLANMLSDRITAPKILDRIAAGWSTPTAAVVNGQIVLGGALDHSATIFSTELEVLLRASDWMLGFLVESWDKHEYEYDTKNKGSAFVKDMCTSLIGGTVPDFLRNIEKDVALPVSGGFTSRCFFIYEENLSRDMPSPPPLETNPVSVAYLKMLKNDLEYIAHTIKGEFTYNTDARILLENFQKRVRSSTDGDSEAVQHFKSRIRAHVLKLAMIISASRKDDNILDKLDMQASISYVESALKNIEKVFRGAGSSELQVDTSKVQAYLEKVGVASKRDLLKAMHRHMTEETLTRVLYLLETIGFLDVVSQGKVTLYKQIGQSPNGRVKP